VKLGEFMKLDEYRLGLLYEQIVRGDFFLIEDYQIDKFDWDIYFSDDYVGIYSSFLIESYEKIKNLEPTPVGVLDQYKIFLNNGMEFVLNINYNNAEQIRKLSKWAIADATIKHRQDIVDGYVYFDNIKDDEYVALVEFQDSKGRHDSTGEVGVYSKEVFSMLTQAVTDSLASNNMHLKTVGIMMLVNKNEPKRLALYKKILEHKLKYVYPIVFVDNNTKSGNNVTILIATK
jgi:hypothetical protein